MKKNLVKCNTLREFVDAILAGKCDAFRHPHEFFTSTEYHEVCVLVHTGRGTISCYGRPSHWYIIHGGPHSRDTVFAVLRHAFNDDALQEMTLVKNSASALAFSGQYGGSLPLWTAKMFSHLSLPGSPELATCDWMEEVFRDNDVTTRMMQRHDFITGAWPQEDETYAIGSHRTFCKWNIGLMLCVKASEEMGRVVTFPEVLDMFPALQRKFFFEAI